MSAICFLLQTRLANRLPEETELLTESVSRTSFENYLIGLLACYCKRSAFPSRIHVVGPPDKESRAVKFFGNVGVELIYHASRQLPERLEGSTEPEDSERARVKSKHPLGLDAPHATGRADAAVTQVEWVLHVKKLFDREYHIKYEDKIRPGVVSQLFDMCLDATEDSLIEIKKFIDAHRAPSIESPDS